MGFARLRAALKGETNPVKRAELIYTAFRMARTTVSCMTIVAPAFVARRRRARPAARLGQLGPDATCARSWPRAGREQPNAGSRALRAVRVLSPDDVTVALALSLRDTLHVRAAQPALANLAQKSLADPEGTGAHATLVFGLFDAMALTMPPEAEVRVQPLMAQHWPGRRPAGNGDAAASKRRRCTSAAARSCWARCRRSGRGPGDLAPDVIVRLVRALQTAGVRDGAHALVAEAASSQ